jgi:hypothetical protein
MIHTQFLFQKHKSKELILEGDMVWNHCTHFWILHLSQGYGRKNIYFLNFTIYFDMNAYDDHKPSKLQ